MSRERHRAPGDAAPAARPPGGLREQPTPSSAFDDLRERLFGSRPPEAFPPSAAAAEPPSPWLRPPAAASGHGGPAEESPWVAAAAGGSAEAPTGAGGPDLPPEHVAAAAEPEPDTSPLPRPVRWSAASASYEPRDPAPAGRARLVGLAFLALAVLGIGVWLLAGPNRARETPAFERPTPTGSTPGGGEVTDVVGVVAKIWVNDRSEVRVHQVTTFSAEVDTLTVHIPRRKADRAAQPFRPRVDGMSLHGKGWETQVDTALRQGRRLTIDLPEPVRTVTIDYRATGAIVPMTPTRSGRGLALTDVVVLDMGVAKRATSSVAVIGGRVLELNCLSDGDLDPCGFDEGGQWVYDLVGDDGFDLLAQIDLPN